MLPLSSDDSGIHNYASRESHLGGMRRGYNYDEWRQHSVVLRETQEEERGAKSQADMMMRL